MQLAAILFKLTSLTVCPLFIFNIYLYELMLLLWARYEFCELFLVFMYAYLHIKRIFSTINSELVKEVHSLYSITDVADLKT